MINQMNESMEQGLNLVLQLTRKGQRPFGESIGVDALRRLFE